MFNFTCCTKFGVKLLSCMKIIVSCISALLITTFCFAQRVTFNKGGINTKNYYQEIPYEFTNGKIYLTPEVNGVKHRFLFDTGAPTQITTELFKELKPEVINTTDITDAAGNKTSLDIVSLKEFKLQALVFNDIPALVASSDLYKCLHIDGVIGSNILRNSIVQIIPGNHVIIITDDELKLKPTPKNQTPLITGEPQSYPFFMVQLSGKKVLKVGFDTGTYNFFRLSDKDAVKLEGSNVFEKLSSGYGASHRSLLGLQAPDSLFRLKMLPFTINSCVFDNVITETGKSNNSRIGIKLLDYGTVTLDFINHRFYFDPFRLGNDLRETLWPIKPVIDQNKLVVGVVWEKLKGQLNAGDQILAIDGTSCEMIDLCKWVNGTSEEVMKGTTATLKVRDNQGRVKEIKVSKE
jgi:hypothetical protein